MRRSHKQWTETKTLPSDHGRLQCEDRKTSAKRPDYNRIAQPREEERTRRDDGPVCSIKEPDNNKHIIQEIKEEKVDLAQFEWRSDE